MIEIKRSYYLKRLHRFIQSPTIVVVTGLRRVGKSILLRQFANEVQEQTSVIYIDKESLDFDAIQNARDLFNYIDGRSTKNVTRLLIIDEVQEIQDWEHALAAVLGRGNTSIVVSGSNASLLSGELATRIAGRYTAFQVFPLDLREFRDLHRLTAKSDLNESELFRTYLRLGGLPGVLHTDLSEIVVHQMLRDIFNTIALRDIITRHQIRNVRLFEDVVMFVMDNIGSLISANRISNFLKSQRRTLSIDTVLNYLSYLQEAYLCEIVNRYNIKGRRYMEVNNKLYLGDIGLRNGLFGYREQDIAGILENLVYLELRRRGFSVSIGTLGEEEIDFVAEGQSGRYYIQIAYQLGSRATMNREIKPLSALDDAYPRFLLSMDPYQPRDLNGIRHRSIVDFLLGEDL